MKHCLFQLYIFSTVFSYFAFFVFIVILTVYLFSNIFWRLFIYYYFFTLISLVFYGAIETGIENFEISLVSKI